MPAQRTLSACLWLSLTIISAMVPAGAQVCEVRSADRLIGTGGEPGDAFGVSVAIDGDVVVAGSHWDDDGAFFDTGTASVFRRAAGGWILEQRLVNPDPDHGDFFGRAVAVSGDVILVGAENGDGASADTGTVHVYRFDGASWNEEALLTASDAQFGDHFGFAVALDGNVALVGARFGDGQGLFSETGTAYVFRHDGSSWNEEARLTASDAMSFDRFGVSVALDGDLAVIGADEGDGTGQFSNTGTAYVFRHDGSSWNEEARLAASDAASFERFGAAVAVDGVVVAIGASHENNGVAPFTRGAVYVYRFDGLAWVEEQKLLAGDAEDFDELGASVALEGDWLVAGANFGDSGPRFDTGAAYVYHHHPASPGPWIEEAKLLDPDGSGAEDPGISVALDGGRPVVGSPSNDVTDFLPAGAAFVFDPLHDCDTDGTLDRCQPDCNLNGIFDACEIAGGSVEDDNLNGIPDVCECGCLDLFFLIDNTGSMSEAISTIQAELPQFVERARARSVDDLRLGLIRFGTMVDVMHDLTFDVDGVLDSLAMIGVGGGGSNPEASDAALQELFEKNVDLACLVDETPQYPEELDPAIDFRPDCLKIAVLLTDALPTGCEDGPPSLEDLANAAEQAQNAADAGVEIFAIYPAVPGDPDAPQIRDIMQNYADVSGGIFAEVEFDGTGLLDAVLEGLDRCVDCNDNGVSDFTDIDTGFSSDQNGNTRPDECDAGACCVSACEDALGDPAASLLACLSGEVPFNLSCQETSAELCDALQQADPLTFTTFEGGADCATAGCGGACCLAEGCVSSPDEADCDGRGGVYGGDGTHCGQPGVCGAGGCCFDGGLACEEGISSTVCGADFGGLWLGPDTSCGEHEICLGACCLLADGETSCRQATRYVCEEVLGGHFSGEGSDCEADDFVGCQGACCESVEACQVMSFEDCSQAELLFAGPGTFCGADDACPDYGGCWAAGTCLVTSRAACAAASGSYLGAGRACGENCAPPPGSCPGDFDLDGDVDEDDLAWFDENVDLGDCTYGIGDCACDRMDLCEVQVYDPECSRAYLEENLGSFCP